MGLLFGDTYVTNKTYNTTSPALINAQKETAEATRQVAKATQNVADAINDDKITISHKRYEELINKKNLLSSIKVDITNRFRALCLIANSEKYKIEYRQMYFMNPFKITLFNQNLNEELCIGMDKNEKIACLYKRSKEKFNAQFQTVEDYGYEIVKFKTPNYMQETDGTAVLSGTEYHSLLDEESLLDNIYMPATEELPNVMFKLINVDSSIDDTSNNNRFLIYINQIFIDKNNFGWGNDFAFLFNSNGFNWKFNYVSNSISIKILNNL